jgi:aspartate/methionine/tyrosine aminotransferase
MRAIVVRVLEDSMLDGCFFARGSRGTTPRVVLVGLDDASLDELHKSPTNISPELAEVVHYPTEHVVAAIGLDLIVPQTLSSRPGLQRGQRGDAVALGQDIADAGNAVLPVQPADDAQRRARRGRGISLSAYRSVGDRPPERAPSGDRRTHVLRVASRLGGLHPRWNEAGTAAELRALAFTHTGARAYNVRLDQQRGRPHEAGFGIALKDEGAGVALPLFVTKALIRTGIARWLPSVRQLIEGGGAFLRYYSDRLLSAPHADVLSTAALLETPGPDAIDLSLGSPRFDLAPSSTTRMPADRRGWPPPAGLPELRAAVAEKLLGDHRLAVSSTDEVLITAGGAGAFSSAIDTFVNPGDRVVLFDPCSPLYPLMLRHRRARIRWVASWVEDGRLRFRADHFQRAMRGARMVVVNSPHNPTGSIFAPQDLEQIAFWADRRAALIFSDEVFERYQYEEEPLSIGTLDRARNRTLTAGSVSKGYALASARVGWLAGHRHLLRPCLLSAILQAAVVPTLSQLVALAALRQDVESFQSIWSDFESRRRYAYERLQALGFRPTWPAGAFFFWLPVWHRDQSGRTFAECLLAEKKVMVTPGDLFGPSGAGYVRLSYAVEDGRLREGLSRLAQFLSGEPSGAKEGARLAA